MEENKLKYSIIIPVFNEEKVIRKVVERCLALNLSDSEIIVVDDGSKDNTVKALDGIDIRTNNNDKYRNKTR